MHIRWPSTPQRATTQANQDGTVKIAQLVKRLQHLTAMSLADEQSE